jgi:hypothetical protein
VVRRHLAHRARRAHRLRPHDPDVPEIGEEIAAARALLDLAGHLLHAAADDLEGVMHEKVTLDS